MKMFIFFEHSKLPGVCLFFHCFKPYFWMAFHYFKNSFFPVISLVVFPGSSAGKESACKKKKKKNLPAMQEMLVRFLGQEVSLENG